MAHALDFLRSAREEGGQALGEYGLIVAFVAIACIVALGTLGVAVTAPFDEVIAGF